MTKAEEKADEFYRGSNPYREHPEEDWKREGFIDGYEEAEEDTIDQACQWLFSHLPILVDYYNDDIHEKIDRSDFIKMFRKEMTEIL